MIHVTERTDKRTKHIKLPFEFMNESNKSKKNVQILDSWISDAYKLQCMSFDQMINDQERHKQTMKKAATATTTPTQMKSLITQYSLSLYP